MSAVALTVIDIVSRQLRHGAVVEASTRLDALDCDSLDVMDAVVAIEDRFGVEIPDATLDAITTVGELAAAVERMAS